MVWSLLTCEVPPPPECVRARHGCVVGALAMDETRQPWATLVVAVCAHTRHSVASMPGLLPLVCVCVLHHRGHLRVMVYANHN